MMARHGRDGRQALALACLAGIGIVTACGGSDTPGIEASGTVEATEADLGFQLSGRVEEVVPREGDAVEAGQVLARLDDAELEAARTAAAAQLEAARARLRELESGSRAEEVRRISLQHTSFRLLGGRQIADSRGRALSGGRRRWRFHSLSANSVAHPGNNDRLGSDSVTNRTDLIVIRWAKTLIMSPLA